MGVQTACYIKIGDLQGQCKDATHIGWIPVLSWGFREERRSPMTIGGDETLVDVLTFRHVMEECSPTIMNWCSDGESIPTVTLSCCRAGGGSRELKRIVMEDCMVTAFNAHSDNDFGAVCETAIVFATIHVQTKGQGLDGQAEPGVVSLFDGKRKTGQ